MPLAFAESSVRVTDMLCTRAILAGDVGGVLLLNFRPGSDHENELAEKLIPKESDAVPGNARESSGTYAPPVSPGRATDHGF